MAGTRVMGTIKPYLTKEGNWFVLRYGFERIEGTDTYMYVEHKFIKRPSDDRIRTLIENYNKEGGNEDADKVINWVDNNYHDYKK
jgi:hypothetical protein